MLFGLESLFELVHVAQQAIYLLENKIFIQPKLTTSNLDVLDPLHFDFNPFDLLLENHLCLFGSVYVISAIESLLPIPLHVSAILDWENSLVARDPLIERILDLNVLFQELAPRVLKKLWISFGEYIGAVD